MNQVPTEMAKSLNIHISCFVDNEPRFRLQAWNWLLSLRLVSSKAKPFIHFSSGAINKDLQDQFTALGASLIEVEPFGEGNARYCNKVLQLESKEFTDADFVILSDADLLFLSDPAALVSPDSFRAKPVDFPNPPAEIWRELFEGAGLTKTVREIELELVPQETTFHTNFNGGLYVIPQSMIGPIAEKWRYYSTMCLERADMMKDFAHHADQVGMGMALAELEFRVESLGIEANFPTHATAEQLSMIEPKELLALHYHHHVDQHGLPKNVGTSWIDSQIEAARDQLIEARRQNFLNEVFWDFRYQMFPELGSGVGSRNESLLAKHQKLGPIFEAIGSDSIIDVGCGDLEVVSPLSIRNYTGIDVSSEAIVAAKTKCPEWEFENKALSEFGDDSFDYAMCIDVLIHQPSLKDAHSLVDDLLRVARKGVILSIHSSTIDSVGISFDTSSLKEYFSTKSDAGRVVEILTYQDVTLFFLEIGLGGRATTSDIGIPEIAVGLDLVENKQGLVDLIEYSREKIGFFPVTVIRTHEYPWFVDQLSNCKGKTALDVGAGVSCIPFKLADMGAHVTTVDLHSVIRNEQPKEIWNEWGYLDYSKFNPLISSFNADMADIDLGESFDVVYSVSVIEHMPASMRRAVITKMAENCKIGGEIILSLDLIPGTDDLWNLSEGNIVDAKGHGTVKDVKSELRKAGFELNEEHILRDTQYSRTDVLYLTGHFSGTKRLGWKDKIKRWL